MSTTNTETTTESTREPSQDSPEPPGRAETLETTPKPGEERTAPESEDVAKLRKEAAGHRVTAREAREELDSTRERLSAVQDALLAGELKARGTQLTPEALRAVGLRDGVFSGDSGTVDAEALDAALEQAQGMGLTIRKRPAPDLTTGRETPPGGEITGAAWSQVFKR